MGNDVPISNDEDADNAIVRKVGDYEAKKKYRFLDKIFDDFVMRILVTWT